MTPKDKKLIAICKVFWERRTGVGIWEDVESEKLSTPENLVYKRLDGLRSIIRPIALGEVNEVDIDILQKEEFKEELNSLLNFLSDPDRHFYPAPHTYSGLEQPDDYTDMAAHSLIFALDTIKLKVDTKIKSTCRSLVSKCLGFLINDEHYFSSIEEKYIAWAGTKYYESPDNSFELKSVYFTSEVVTSLGEWLQNPIEPGPKPDKEKQAKFKSIINNACRWIIFHDVNEDGILTIAPDKVTISIEELVTTNTTAISACILQWENLEETIKQRTKDIAEKIVSFLKEYIPKDTSWYRQVYTKKMAYQAYQDRQGMFGIVRFLGLAQKILDDSLKSEIDNIAESYINQYLPLKADDLEISSFPWYIEDIIHTERYFSDLHVSIEVTMPILKKAIKQSLSNTKIIESVARTTIVAINDIIAKITAEEMACRMERTKDKSFKAKTKPKSKKDKKK